MPGRAAITGATGFIGWHLASMLRDRGWQVRAITRAESRRPVPIGIDRLTSSFNESDLIRCLSKADVVFHLAGATRPYRSNLHDANVCGTRELVRAVRALGTRLVHVSSQSVSGPATAKLPATEDMPPRPITPYAASKLEGEQIVRAAQLHAWTILRPASVYGPRDRNFLPLFRLASHGLFPLVHRPTAGYTLIHVDDLSRGILAAGTSPAAIGETFFLGHSEPCTASSILEALARLAGRRYRPFPVPRPMLWAAAMTGELCGRLGVTVALDLARLRELTADGFVCQVEKARQRLGFVPEIDLFGGLADTMTWYRHQGWLGRATVRRAV